jgi:alpha-mannosidase
VDISNSKQGVTWSTADAPLMELGGLTANLPRGQSDPNAYMKTIKPSATIYSWVMNNHWHTNYRADQEGPTWFRYALWPHGGYDAVASMRFGVESTQSLIVAPATGAKPVPGRLRLESDKLIATAFKPSDDGKALIVRLFNPTDQPQVTRLKWNKPVGQAWISSGREDQLEKASSEVTLSKFGVVTLRVEK